MAIIQISKIQLRRGPEADLPGSPISFSPLTFSPGLDTGELGFATDSGRLFIGHDPLVGSVNYNRSTFPYRNIEVLTETADETLDTVIGDRIRDLPSGQSYYGAELPITGGGSWGIIDTLTNPVISFRTSDTPSTFEIDYAVFRTTDDVPIKRGRLHVLNTGGIDEPQCLDLTMATPDLTGGTDPDASFSGVRFRFTAQSDLTGPYVQFEYQNTTADDLVLRFRRLRAIVG